MTLSASEHAIGDVRNGDGGVISVIDVGGLEVKVSLAYCGDSSSQNLGDVLDA